MLIISSVISIYADMMMIEAMKDLKERVRERRNAKGIKVCRDQGIVAQTEQGQQKIMENKTLTIFKILLIFFILMIV